MYQRKIAIFFFVAVFLLGICSSLNIHSSAGATGSVQWFNSDWTSRRSITIDNSLNPTNLYNYQVKVNLLFSPAMQSNFADLRFTSSDGATLIPFWIENYTASVSATVWVRVPNVPAFSTTTIYVYYGNPNANSLSNGTATFEFFENFENPYPSPWTNGSSLPVPISDGTAAVYNNQLYFFGGYGQTASDIKNSTYVYYPSSNVWTQKADMPTPRWGEIAVQYNGKIYVFGGYPPTGPAYPHTNQIYDPATNTWTTGTNVPLVLNNEGLMGVVYGNLIHLFHEHWHFVYDPSTDTYTQMADVPTARTWATCAVANNHIYVIGGFNTTAANPQVNEVYDPATNTWQTKSPPLVNLYGATRENPVINGKIYVVGGQVDGGFYSTNFVYDPSADKWTTMSEEPTPRDGVACGVIQGKLYVVGGRADFVGPYGLNYNEIYDPTSDTGSSLGPSWAVSGSNSVYIDTSAKNEGNSGLLINGSSFNSFLSPWAYAEHTFSPAYLVVDLDWDMTNYSGMSNFQPQGRIMLVDPSLYNIGNLVLL